MKKIIPLFFLVISTVTTYATDAGIKPYPLDRCIVSDEKLGEMGPPVVFIYQNQEIKLCCKDCRKDFDADPEKYLKKLSDKPAPKSGEQTNTPAESSGTVVQLTVDGLVCNFCAANIDKSFHKLPEVQDVYVNLAAKTVLLRLKPGASFSEEKVKEIVVNAGFNLREVKQPKESFETIQSKLKEIKK
jgi:copper chaperone CopZ